MGGSQSVCCCTHSKDDQVVQDIDTAIEKGVKFSASPDEEETFEKVSYSTDLGDMSRVFVFEDDSDTDEETAAIAAAHRNLRRNQTFYLLNEAEENESPQQAMDMVRKMSSSRSGLSESVVKMDSSEKAATEVEKAKKDMLNQVASLVDKAYDILPAEMLLAEVEQLIGQEAFLKEVVCSDLFERFCRKLDYFYDVGKACAQNQDDWIEVFNGESGKQTIHGAIDKNDATNIQYIVRAEIPTRLTNVLAVANEIQLMPQWNSLVVGQPETIGRRTAHYMVLNYQVSAIGGMYKVDVLNEIRRFTDQHGGFLVEHIHSVDKDHPSFKEPEKGFKRMQTLLKNVVLACGPDHCLLIQVGKLKLPFTCSKWLAKTIGQLAGKFIIGGLVSNSMRAGAPGNPWEALIAEDSLGLYQRLQECMQAAESLKREPANGQLGQLDMAEYFTRRRFHRDSQRKRKRLSKLEEEEKKE